MQRKNKFLGSALALATLSLICLEVSNADEAAQSAASVTSPTLEAGTAAPTAPVDPAAVPAPAVPAAASAPESGAPTTPAAQTPATAEAPTSPATAPAAETPASASVTATETPPLVAAAPRMQSLVTIQSAIDPRTPSVVVLEVIQNPAGEIQQFFYHPIGSTEERLYCSPSSISRANCLISLAEAMSPNGVTLEKAYPERGRRRFHKVAVLKVDDDFSSTHGGRITLEYLSIIPDLTNERTYADGELTDDIKEPFDMVLRKVDGKWVLTTIPRNTGREVQFNYLQFVTRMRSIFFGSFPCGISEIIPSTR